MSLPRRLFCAAEQDAAVPLRAGGLEYAFMSTTMDKEEAMKYARRAPGMILFEIDQGFVARGASISWLSQYAPQPHRSRAP